MSGIAYFPRYPSFCFWTKYFFSRTYRQIELKLAMVLNTVKNYFEENNQSNRKPRFKMAAV